MVADFKRTDDWNAITKELDGLNAADFSGQSLSTVTFNDKSVPLVKDRPSILLYGLTEEDRFNGSAEALRSFLDKQDGLSLLQAVSGAGKTRAVIDVFANTTTLCEKTELLYFDLSALKGTTPTKNFFQLDIEQLKGKLPCESRDEGSRLFRRLLLARTLILEYLRGKGWTSANLLFAQLAVHFDKVIKESARVFHVLAKYIIEDESILLNQGYVALDEANIALAKVFGSYEGTTQEGKIRPFLSCISDAVNGIPCVLSGTSYRMKAVLDSLVSNSTPENDIAGFNEMTRMVTASDVAVMLQRFGVDTTNRTSRIPEESLALLVGRCRFVAVALVKLIQLARGSERELSTEGIGIVSSNVATREDKLGEVIDKAVDSIIEYFTPLIAERLASDPGSAATFETITVASLIDKPLRYKDATESARLWADESFFWVTGEENSFELQEPLIVRSSQNAMSTLGQGWDPVGWIVARMHQPVISAAQQGFDFEQVAGRKLSTSLSNGEFQIRDSKGAPVPVIEAPDEATALVVKATELTMDQFLATPQCAHIFLPANKDGPDVVFWQRCAGSIWYVVFIQAKFYKNKISGQATKAAAKTV